MTIIGDRRRFALEVIPVRPSWEVRYPPEAAAWAGTAIWVDGSNLCRHVPAGTGEVEDYFYLPLGPVADWIIRSFPAVAFEERAAIYPTSDWPFDSLEGWGSSAPAQGIAEDAWLDARHDWWSRHFLEAGADGAFVPNLSFVRNDEKLVVAWRPPVFPAGSSRPEMINSQGASVIDWGEAVEILEQFTSLVAEWFREEGVPTAFPWTDSERPLTGGDHELPRALELMTGRSVDALETLFDAGRYEDLLGAIGLPADAVDPGASAECQVLRDLSPSLPDHFGDVFRDLTESTRAAGHQDDELASWRGMRSLVDDATRAARDEREAGSFAAYAVRRALDMNGQAIGDVGQLAEECGLRHENLNESGGKDRMVVALRESGGLASRAFRTPRTSVEWGRRFETARALGHVLLDPLRGGRSVRPRGRSPNRREPVDRACSPPSSSCPRRLRPGRAEGPSMASARRIPSGGCWRSSGSVPRPPRGSCGAMVGFRATRSVKS